MSETSFYVQRARLTREESAWVAELVAAVQLPSEDADAPRLDDDLVLAGAADGNVANTLYNNVGFECLIPGENNFI